MIDLDGPLASRLVAEAPVLLLTIDRRGVIEYANRRLEALAGLPIGGRAWLDACVPAVAAELRARFHAALAAGEPFVGVAPLVAASGEARRIEWRFTPLVEADGRLTRYAGVGLDLADDDRSAVSDDAPLVQPLLDAFPDWVAVFRPDGAFLAGNGESRPPALLGPGRARWDEAIRDLRPDLIATADAAFARAARGEHVELDASDAHSGGYTITLRPLRDPTGATTQVLARLLDTSARNRALVALRESEAQLNDAQQLARLGSWALDLRHNRLVWSDEIYRIFEIDPRAFGASYEAFLAAVHPDDRAAVHDAYQRSVAERRPYEIVHRLLFADGRIKHVRELGNSIYDDDGAPLRSLGTVHDITASIEAEQRLRSILDGVPAHLTVYDDDGRILHCSNVPQTAPPPTGELRGTPADQVPWLAHSADERAKVLAAIARARRGERARAEVRLEIAPGRFVDHDLTVAPLRGDGGVRGVIASGVDITERKRDEEVLRTHSRVLHAMGEGVYFSGGDGRIRFVNPALERLFGHDPGGLLGQHVSALTGASEVESQAHHAAIVDALAREGRYEGVLRCRRHDGRTFHARLSITELHTPGETLWVSILEDISARVTAESALQRALAEKEILLREIHHRVKNNLQVISSLLHFQAKKATTPADVAAFSEGRDRLLAMILVHERLYQSRDLSQIAFDDYVRALVSGLLASFDRPDRLRVDLDLTSARLPIEIALPLGMILCELLTNAAKYAAPAVGPCAVQICARERGPELVVAVADDGPGFPPGFSPARVTSFGWNLIRNLVAQLDGRLEHTSDGGARVTIAAPLPGDSACPAEEPAA